MAVCAAGLSFLNIAEIEYNRKLIYLSNIFKLPDIFKGLHIWIKRGRFRVLSLITVMYICCVFGLDYFAAGINGLRFYFTDYVEQAAVAPFHDGDDLIVEFDLFGDAGYFIHFVHELID